MEGIILGLAFMAILTAGIIVFVNFVGGVFENDKDVELDSTFTKSKVFQSIIENNGVYLKKSYS